MDGACEAAAGRPLLRQECCCSVGLAWGSPCTPCDREHCPCSKGFAKLDGAECRDVDECALEPELCAGGRCVNTDGSYRCECPRGMHLDEAGHRCVDTRHEACYAEYQAGRCDAALETPVLKAVCCCSSLGRGWGDDRCEPCPRKGTDSFRALCVADAGGSPTIWEKPGAGAGANGSDIWGEGGPGGEDGPGGDHGGSWKNGSDLWGGGGQGGGSMMPGQVDVNECASFSGLCSHGTCKNTPGGFVCECDRGYDLVSDNI